MKLITHCRACGSKALTPAFELAECAFPSGPGRKPRRGSRAKDAIEFVLCDPSVDARACGLLQSARPRTPPPVASAPSSRHASTRAHLRRIATESLELISGRDCAALDIGCDDGALLSFYPRWVERYGVDAGARVEDVGDWAWTARDAFPSSALDGAFGDRRFDIITAINVLEEVEAPRAFLKRVKDLLAPDGVVAIETLYAPMSLMRTGVDSIIAGVCALYSLGALERLAREAGLKIFRGALTDKDGGSIRLYLTHDACEGHDFDPWYERLARLWDEENAFALRTLPPYQAFEHRARASRAAFGAMLEEIAARDETVFILGSTPASAATMIWAGDSAKAVVAAVDEDAGRDGADRLMGGPVILSETEARAAGPNFFLAPASLKRETLERWRDAIQLGAEIIFATPTPHIVNKRNYAAELARILADGDAAGEVETLRAIMVAAGGPRLVAVNTPVAASA